MRTKSYGHFYHRLHDVARELKNGPLTYERIAEKWMVTEKTALRYVRILQELYPKQIRLEKNVSFKKGDRLKIVWIGKRERDARA